MSTIDNINSPQNLDIQIQTNKNLKQSTNKKMLIVFVIVLGCTLITTIVLLAVLLPRKGKKAPRIYISTFQETDDSGQTIELLIDGKDLGKSRFLQEEEKVQILGNNFNELNSNNSIVYIDGEKVSFDKYLSIKSTSSVKVVINFYVKFLTFKEMFSGCQKIKEISLINVEPDFISETTSMFENCTSLRGVHFKNSSLYNITSTANMFKNCPSLNTIDLEGFLTNTTKDMSKMFKGCSSLSNNSFIERLSTNNAEFLNEMLSDCSSIKSLNLSGFNTPNVKNMSGMFKDMSNLEKLELSSFHTEKVEDMSKMFESCKSISYLDLSNFNTEMVITMDLMFANCLKLIKLIVTSFKLTRCNSTQYMFTNTTRELMLSIEENEELMTNAALSWSEKKDEESNIAKAKTPLYILFIVDATGSMSSVIERVKSNIIYIAVNLLKKKGMKNYDLSLGAIFYRDPIGSRMDIHEIFDFDKNALNFKNFIKNINATGGGDGPEDWAGAFNLAKNLTWRQNATKFIIHIADAPAHGKFWGIDKSYPEEGIKTDEIITYFAKNNFSIAGFKVSDYGSLSFLRAQDIFKNNSNKNYFIKEFFSDETDEDYLLNLVYDSFQGIFIDDVKVIKKEVWAWYETKVGSHYYAYSPYTVGYSKVTSDIKLPDKLNTNNGERNAYISFGVSGQYYSVDTGIRNNGTGWCPYHYDVNRSDFHVSDDYIAPSRTSIIGIEIKITSERVINFSIAFKDSSLRILKSFNEKIDASHILIYEEGKPIFRFYRFASLVNVGEDNQNDNTYMQGGKFTKLGIVRDNVAYPWGIASDDIWASWKVSTKRINVTYTENSDIFDIYHQIPDDD